MSVARRAVFALVTLVAAPALAADPPPVSNPPDGADHFNRGLARERAKDFDGGIAAYDAAIKLRPRYAKAYLHRGWAWHQKKDLGRAAADFDTSIELNPWDAAAFARRGAVLVDLKQYDRAAADFAEAIRLDSTDPRDYANRGYALGRLGRAAEAEEDYARYIRARPADPDGYVWRGFQRVRAGENHRSTFDFDEALRLKPDHPDAYHGRGLARGRMKLFDQAFADFAESLRLRPGVVSAYTDRAAIHLMVPDAAKAVQDFSEATRLDPALHFAYQQRAWVRATSPDAGVRDGEQAVADARRACELTNWQEPAYLDTLAAAEAECGRFAEAVQYVNRALRFETYDKSPAGDGARWRLKAYEEGKACRDGTPAEVPAAARPAGVLSEKAVAEYGFMAAAGLGVRSMVAFRLRKHGVFPLRRRPAPVEAPAAESPGMFRQGTRSSLTVNLGRGVRHPQAFEAAGEWEPPTDRPRSPNRHPARKAA